jgi:hypothetical protein
LLRKRSAAFTEHSLAAPLAAPVALGDQEGALVGGEQLVAKQETNHSHGSHAPTLTVLR